MRPLLVALLLLPAVGSAQTLTLTVNGATTSVSGNGSTTTSTLAFNQSGCGYTVGGSWTGTGLTAACTSLVIWTTAFTCTGPMPSTTNSPPDIPVYTAQAGQLTGGLTNDTFSFPFNSLPGFTAAAVDAGIGGACGSVTAFTNQLCAGVTLAATGGMCNGSAITATSVNLIYDNVPPDPPLVTVTALDSKLSVALTPVGTDLTGVSNYQVQYAVEFPDGDAGVPVTVPGNISPANAKVTINNLVNGITYIIEGFTVDGAGNISAASNPVPGTPVVTYGFYANYLDDGGQPGGCGDAAGGAPSALAFATVLLLAVARRRG